MGRRYSILYILVLEEHTQTRVSLNVSQTTTSFPLLRPFKQYSFVVFPLSIIVFFSYSSTKDGLRRANRPHLLSPTYLRPPSYILE
jgi:hypothetical protein